MKRGVVVLIIVSLGILSLHASAFAQTATSSAASQEVSYDLPYPGLLPDNPLYIFKVFRDAMIGLLISDPLKKAQFDLLNSDKRVNASYFLFQKREYRLAVDTLSKSNNYLHDSIAETQIAKKQGSTVGEFKNQLKSAIQRHEELVEGMEKNAQGSIKSGTVNEEKRLEEFQANLRKL